MSYVARAKIEIHTAPSRGENPESFKMFEIELELIPSLHDWLLWLDQGFLPSYEKLPTIRPTQVKQIDEGTFEFSANMVVTPASDSFEYYRKLAMDGWKPNTEEDDAIRSRGYKHFYPKDFVGDLV